MEYDPTRGTIVPGVRSTLIPGGSSGIGLGSYDRFFDPYLQEDQLLEAATCSNLVDARPPPGPPHRQWKRHRERSPSPEPARNPDPIKLEPHDTPDSSEVLRRIRSSEPKRTQISDQPALEEFERALSAIKRPPPPEDYVVAQDGLSVYLLDLDYHTPFWSKDGSPVIRVFGLTPEGHSVALYIEGFAPYFLVRVNDTLAKKFADHPHDHDSVINAFWKWLNERAMNRDPRPPKAEDQQGIYVRSIRRVRKRSIFDYEPATSDFLAIETVQPRMVPLLRDLLQGKGSKVISRQRLKREAEEYDEADSGMPASIDEDDDEAVAAAMEEDAAERVPMDMGARDLDYGTFEVFEADIQFALNFLVDKDLKGCGWFRVPRSALRAVHESAECYTQLQYACHSDAVQSLPGKSDVPAIRVLSVDIECAGKDARFPLPQEDPIICISALLYKIQDGARAAVSLGLGVGDIAEPHSKDLVCIQFGRGKPVVDERTGEWNKEAEVDMLLAFWRFVVEIADPDFLSGYNSDNFDNPYLIKRADALGIGRVFRDMSRVKQELCTLQKGTFSSKAFGTRTDLNLRCPGRVTWDCMRITRRAMKLRSYTLNHVADEVLGKKKHEISHDQIGPLWLGDKSTPETRRRVIEYNEHDARLSYEISARKLYLYEYQELARATGVVIDRILKQGQGVKTLSQVLRAARAEDYAIPTFASFKEKCIRAGFPEMLQGDAALAARARVIEKEHRRNNRGAPSVKRQFFGSSDGDDYEKKCNDLRLGPNDLCILAVCKSGPHLQDLAVSQRLGVWAGTRGKERDFENAYKTARKKQGRALMFFTVFGTGTLHGVAQIASELKLTTTANDKKRWHDPDAYGWDFSVKWLSVPDKKPKLPMKLERANDGELIYAEEARVLLAHCIDALPRFGDRAVMKNRKQDSADDDDMDVDEIEGSAYEGAIVIDPILGYYRVPVATLDFSSLYPSIIITWNLDWSTRTTKAHCEKLGYKERAKGADGRYAPVFDAKGVYHPELDGDFVVTPANHYFVTQKHRTGLLPGILRSLLFRRGIAKKILAGVKGVKGALGDVRKKNSVDFAPIFEAQKKLEETVNKEEPTAIDLFAPFKAEFERCAQIADEKERLDQLLGFYETFESFEATFDSRQNALKISANSAYGFTGAVVGSLPQKAIAESVTAFGREAIELKRRAIERDFPMPDEMTKNGTMRPIVIGGDTDSIFIIFPGCDTPALAMEWAKKAAAWINDKFFQKPMETVFEKIYFPAEYLAPKRYAGRYWSKPDKPDQVVKDGKSMDRIDTKGAESVRRDNCLMVSEAVATLLRKMLAEDDILGAISHIAVLVEDLRTGRADLSKLIISKSLSKKPEDYYPIPVHAQLAIKLAERDAATAPRVGDRVPYLITAPEVEKTAKVSACGEDPKYVLDHDVPIFTNKYLDMLRAPVERVLEPVVPGVSRLIFEGSYKKPVVQPSLQALFARGKRARGEEVPDSEANETALDPTDPEVKKKQKQKKARTQSDHEPSNRTLEWARSKSRIKIGDVEKHIREILSHKRKAEDGDVAATTARKRFDERTSTASPLIRLGTVQIVPKCFGCQRPVPTNRPRRDDAPACAACAPMKCDCEEKVGAPVLCDACLKRPAAVENMKVYHQDSRRQLEAARAKNAERWEICRKCVGSVEDSESCAYKECFNWFARADSRKELTKAQKKLDRFNY